MDKFMIIVNSVIYGVNDLAQRMMLFLTTPFVYSPTAILPPSLSGSETFVRLWYSIMDFIGFVDSSTGYINEISTIEVLVGSSILIVIFLQIVRFIKDVMF